MQGGAFASSRILATWHSRKEGPADGGVGSVVVLCRCSDLLYVSVRQYGYPQPEDGTTFGLEGFRGRWKTTAGR